MNNSILQGVGASLFSFLKENERRWWFDPMINCLWWYAMFVAVLSLLLLFLLFGLFLSKKGKPKKRNIFQWKILKSVLDLILFKSLLLVSLNLMCFGVTINGKRWLWGLLWAMPDCFGYFCFRKFVDITRKVNKRNLNCDNGSLLGLF